MLLVCDAVIHSAEYGAAHRQAYWILSLLAESPEAQTIGRYLWWFVLREAVPAEEVCRRALQE